MIFIHPGTVVVDFHRARHPVTTTTGKMAALLPAPRSPCPSPAGHSLALGTLTRLCLSTLAPSEPACSPPSPRAWIPSHHPRALGHVALLLGLPRGVAELQPLVRAGTSAGGVRLRAVRSSGGMSAGVYVTLCLRIARGGGTLPVCGCWE